MDYKEIEEYILRLPDINYPAKGETPTGRIRSNPPFQNIPIRTELGIRFRNMWNNLYRLGENKMHLDWPREHWPGELPENPPFLRYCREISQTCDIPLMEVVSKMYCQVQLVQHIPSGETYVLLIWGKQTIGITGPLHYTEWRGDDLNPLPNWHRKEWKWEDEDTDWADSQQWNLIDTRRLE